MTAMTRTLDRYLDEEAVAAFGAELDALRRRIRASLGAPDLAYIRRLMRWQRRLEYGGRAAIHAGTVLPPLWLAGVGALAVSKILDSMEIGHNIMHGQYDWSVAPDLRGRDYEWGLLCPGDQWRHVHNMIHHRYTNIVGQDRDVGYGILRVAEAQPWQRRHLLQPAMVLFMFLTFEWGISLHDLELERILERRWHWREQKQKVFAVVRKWRRLVAQDYLLFPALAGPLFLPVLLGNLSANVLRNMWAFAVIFCGHFPEGTQVFMPEECRNESRGAWYLRQLLGSSNFTGGRLLHLLSGHLSHQIEHHLFPNIPAHRYPEMAQEVQALCRRYGLPYNTASMPRQVSSVLRRLLRLWLPRTAAA